MSEHKPVLHIYQDDDSYFAALPSFENLQESEIARLDSASVKRLRFILKHIGGESDATLFFNGEEKDTIFKRAKLNSEHPGQWGKREEFVVKEEWGE